MASITENTRNENSLSIALDEGNFDRIPPPMVVFPNIARQKIDLPQLKLEVEESTEDMSPSNMWQVYALGGFMVGRWIWARWRERRGRPSEE